jgi:hypothetical protein
MTMTMTDPAPPAARTRRRHPASATRILAVGISTASALGLIAAIGPGGADPAPAAARPAAVAAQTPGSPPAPDPVATSGAS